MGGPVVLRNALLASGALAATFVGVGLAHAQDGLPAASVELSDPSNLNPEDPALNLTVRNDTTARFPASQQNTLPDVQGPRRFELELAAGGGDSPVDVSVAQRASFGSDGNGDIDRRASGSEVRVGRGLVDRRENNTNGGSSVYAFVASDNEALTWRPGGRSDLGGDSGSFALQEQVEVGDMSAGVTYERNGVQASLAYVQREESARVGVQSFSQDQSFTGITVTMRR